MMLARPIQRVARPRSIGVVAMIMSVALLVAACSEGGKTEETTPATSAVEDPVTVAQARVAAAEGGVSAAQSALTSTHEDFCGSAKGYVEALDRYGRVFADRAATVGDVQTLGADLVEPRDEVVTSADAVETAKDDLAAAQQELVDAESALAVAIAAASSVAVSSTTQTSIETTTLVPAATIDRVQQAEEDLARTARGINADTALVDAGAAYNSAALALEIAWLNLLNDAGCLSAERQAEAATQLAAYTTALQTDLQQAGYDVGPIDGVYGPKTAAAVEQLQTDSGLAVTGFVDEATARALQTKLDAVGQQQATQTTALQTALKLAGFWDGPIDGQWTDQLTQALKDLQTALGVEPTGQVDAATVAAFQQSITTLETAATSVTTATATVTATATATATAISTALAITTATATETVTTIAPTTIDTSSAPATTG